MGACHSKPSSASAPPTREPTVLLTTSAGVIVRLPDAQSGDSCFHHNPRFLPPATVADALERAHRGSEGAQSVMVAKAGAKNDALKSKVVYVKKPPRPQTKAELKEPSSVQ